ncbi:unnamed protein product [Rhodiola kirilowii]
MLASQRVIDMSHDKIPVGRSCCNIICWPICYLHVALRKIANGRTKMLHGYNLLQGEVWIYYQAFGADAVPEPETMLQFVHPCFTEMFRAVW